MESSLDTAVNLAAAVAEFYALDVEFRAAIESISMEQRLRIYELLIFLLEDPSRNFRIVDGNVRTMEKNFPPRQALLRFFVSLSKSPVISKIHAESARPSRTLQPNYTLPMRQQQEKRRGNDFFRAGQFAEALGIGLNLLKCSGLQRNPTIVGFVMNCYYRLNDFQNALRYAKDLLVLEDDNKVATGIAMMSAHRLRNYGEALFYAEEMLSLESRNKQAMGVAALAAQRLERYEEALSYARRGLDIEPNNMTDLGIAMHCAVKLERYEDAHEVVIRLLQNDPYNISNIGAAVHIAYNLGLYEEVVQYGTQILLRQPKNVTVLPKVIFALRKLGSNDEAARRQRQFDAATKTEGAPPEHPGESAAAVVQ